MFIKLAKGSLEVEPWILPRGRGFESHPIDVTNDSYFFEKGLIKKYFSVMAHVYEAQTKEMIDFPAYNLCFLNVIFNKLETYGLIDGKPSKTGAEPPNVLVIPVISRLYSYCHDGIELIQKTLKRRGFDCTCSKYKVVKVPLKDGSGEQDGFSYEFKLTKIEKK